LRGLSFEVKAGETLGVVGANGAGKSTILGLAAGVLRPTSGTVKVSGRIAPLLELGAGFHRDLTGRENIILNGVLLGLTRAGVTDRLDAIMDFSELGQFIDQPVRVYSNGMLARLGFSVAAHLDPEIMLIDEVLAVGDEGFQKKCLDKMREFKKRGVTLLFVSHSMESVQLICDRVLWIEDRAIKLAGSPGEVVKKYLAGGALVRRPE
jgi:lipopolysaccharide transport system ATP-binding protein